LAWCPRGGLEGRVIAPTATPQKPPS
jgi:hypothetical protein